MIRKLKKHSHILSKRLNHASQEKKLNEVGHSYLSLIYGIIADSKNDYFIQEDFEHFERCEVYRNFLLESDQEITYEIFGSDRKAIVKDICKKAASSQSWCRLIYHLVKKSKSDVVLEVGTNLGVSEAIFYLHFMEEKKEHLSAWKVFKNYVTLQNHSLKKLIPQKNTRFGKDCTRTLSIKP